MINLIDNLSETNNIDRENLLTLLNNIDDETANYLYTKALNAKKNVYGDSVYIRGLIEFTNVCKNNCMYCGIQRSNKNIHRYRLTFDEIIETCKRGIDFGYRTVVLQGGEDSTFTDDDIAKIVSTIKSINIDCAVTLSIGEKSYSSYKKYYDAGADRYLLRHETTNQSLYRHLHPNMDLNNRLECLHSLKEIGYQVGSGFIVGLPMQTTEDYVNDLLFLKNLEPQMIGIGPFISHKDTPLKNCANGSARLTCILLSILRLLLPKVLLPATTALNTVDNNGRLMGLRAGANVVMPNLTPNSVRDKYTLYDNKAISGNEEGLNLNDVKASIEQAGFKMDMGRGDYLI